MNIERHARATHVSITLLATDQGLRLTIVDDGVGFNVLQVLRSHNGIGLRNIRERVEHLEGQLQLTSTPGRTMLDVLLPIKKTGKNAV